MSTCKSCGAEIRFVKTITGNTMPIDLTPTPDGIVQIFANGIARVIPTDERAALPATAVRYTSHFATCPTAAEHRQALTKGRSKK